MLIPGADSHRAKAALSLLTAFFAEGQGRYLTTVSFSPALSPICLISPGAALPSQIQDLGPASVGITYFEVLAFLLKNI